MSLRSTSKGGRRIHGRFVALQYEYFATVEFAALSGRAIKLLVAVALQYNGKNNGDLLVTSSVMAARGFRSNDQLMKARDELIKGGWLMVTRQGGRNMPSLYAMTWEPIDRCGGKHDVKQDTMPRHLWKTANKHLRECPTRKGLPRTAVQVIPHDGATLNRNAGHGVQH